MRSRIAFRLALTVSLLAWMAWLFRYDITSVDGDRAAAYVLDRWTGEVHLIRGAQRKVVYDPWGVAQVLPE